MKRLLPFLAFLPSAACAAILSLSWTPSTTSNVSYAVYAGTNSVMPALRVFSATNRVRLDFDAAGTWFFWATGVATSGIESDPSNVLRVEIPQPPTDLHPVAVEYAFDLTTTNWQQAGTVFLRLKP